MKINPTLIVTSSQICEEVFLSYLNELNDSFDELGVKFISEKLGLLQLDENLSLRDHEGEILLQYNQESKWGASDFWKEYDRNDEKFISIIRNKENSIKSLLTSNDLITNYDISIGNTLNILVVLPTYKLSESVFLSWLLNIFSKKINHSNTNFYFIGLLPEVEDFTTKAIPSNYQRSFACLTECDEIIGKQQDLVNLFALLSNKNENNDFVGNDASINSVIKSCFSFIFESENSVFFNNRQNNLIPSFGKLGMFSSIGFSSYVYKRQRLLDLFISKIHLKIIDGAIRYFNEEINYRSLLSEVDRFSISKSWNDKNKLFEDIEYASFSRANKFDNIIYLSEKGTDSLLKELDDAKASHFDSAGGYFKSEYLPQINTQLSKKIDTDKIAIIEKLKEKLRNGGIGAFHESLAFSYLLCGKHPTDFFKGEIDTGQFNFSIARFKSADYFRDSLDEETNKIYSKDFLVTENNLKNKLTELVKVKKEIDVLEKRIYGFKESIVELKDQSKRNLFFNINGVEISLSGLADYSKELPPSITVYTSPLNSDTIPGYVDFRDYMSPVENQKSLKSCAANAVVSCCEYFYNRATNEFKDLSRLFVYYNARFKSSTHDQDSGSAIFDCIESLMVNESGLCAESVWPYNENSVNARPANKAYEEGKKFQALEVCNVETNLDSLRGCLAEGYPVVFGLKLFNSFQNVGGKGIVPMPISDEMSHDKHGLHAMLCVGYSDIDRYFIVKNSWGNEWGDKGYCYIPYEYLCNKDLNINTSFIIKKISLMPEGFDLKRGISKESASLFTFGNDATILKLYKDQREKLTKEVSEIQLNFEQLKYDFEEQNYLVLKNDFINTSRDIKTETINESINLEIEKIKAIDNEIATTKNEKDLMIEKRNVFRKIYFIFIPVLLLLSMVVFYYYFPGFLEDILQSILGVYFILKTYFLISLAFTIYVLIRYQSKILNPLNSLQQKLTEQNDLRQTSIKSIITSYDNYFEVYRQSELYKVYIEFIHKLDHFINETLISGLKNWKNKIDLYKENLITKADLFDLTDSFNIKQACKASDIDEICLKMNIDTQFLLNGKKSLLPYIFGENEILSADKGFSMFVEEANNFSQASEEKRVLSNLTIIDFICNSDEVKSILNKKKIENLEGILNYLSTTSSPLLPLYSPIGVPTTIQNLNLSMPQLENQYYQNIIQHIRSKNLNSNEILHQNNNITKNDSTVSFFRTKSMLPGYIVSSLQESKRFFDQLSEEEKLKQFSDSTFVNCKLFPDEMLN